MSDREYDLVIFDGDETLIDGDVIDALGVHVGVADEIEETKQRVWQDDLDAMEALEDHIFPLFEGTSIDEVKEVVQSLSYAPGARTLGRHVTCQTAIFTALAPLARRVADELRLDYTRANEPIKARGVLTGELEGSIVDEGKGPAFDDLVETLGVEPDRVIAIGDGPHDRPLFERAGFSIGVDPKPTIKDVPDVVVPEQNFALVAPYLEERGVLDPAFDLTVDTV